MDRIPLHPLDEPQSCVGDLLRFRPELQLRCEAEDVQTGIWNKGGAINKILAGRARKMGRRFYGGIWLIVWRIGRNVRKDGAVTTVWYWVGEDVFWFLINDTFVYNFIKRGKVEGKRLLLEKKELTIWKEHCSFTKTIRLMKLKLKTNWTLYLYHFKIYFYFIYNL